MVKPSESTPHVSSLLAELVSKYLDPELVAVVNGGIPETTRILELPWDHSQSLYTLRNHDQEALTIIHPSSLHW